MEMGLPNAWKIAAGPDNAIYALAKPWKKMFHYTIFRYTGHGWEQLDSPGAWNIAIGRKMYKVDFPMGRVFNSKFIDVAQKQAECKEANRR